MPSSKKSRAVPSGQPPADAVDQSPGTKAPALATAPPKPALEATKGAGKALLHWSSPVALAAVLPAAHWLASDQANGGQGGLVFAASFAVFALLLPAVGILREYVDRRTTLLQEVIRKGEAATPEQLESQRRMFSRLAKTVSSLQRGIVLAVLAALAASAAILAPTVTPWHGAPAYFSFSVQQILTALTLVCLVDAIIAMFPFTWHLLVKAEQLGVLEQAARLALKRATEPASAANTAPAEPNNPGQSGQDGSADAPPGG